MILTFCFLLSINFLYQAQAYRYRIFSETENLCNNLTCKGGIQHTVCKQFSPNPRCSEFSMMEMSSDAINTMLLGHNGIRNKIAIDWNIGNMNILHWSKELERLAAYFLMDCQTKKDVCDFLVQPNIKVGQNYHFSEHPPSARWSGQPIRKWYFELGFRIKHWNEFREARKSNDSLEHFTQMIWPTTEFVGCAAAKMFDGYLSTCYYHPPLDDNWIDFTIGEGCSRCPEDRPTCSRDFTALCGLDVPYASSGHLVNTFSSNIERFLLYSMIFFTVLNLQFF